MSVNFDKTPWNAGPGELPGDDANEMAQAVQCDNCHKMFDPAEEGCFIGFHKSFGDCCQCAECVEVATNSPFYKGF